MLLFALPFHSPQPHDHSNVASACSMTVLALRSVAPRTNCGCFPVALHWCQDAYVHRNFPGRELVYEAATSRAAMLFPTRLPTHAHTHTCGADRLRPAAQTLCKGSCFYAHTTTSMVRGNALSSAAALWLAAVSVRHGCGSLL